MRGRGPGFAARFPDVCPRCGRDIVPGDRVVAVRRTDDGYGARTIHVECAAGQDEA